MAKVNQRTWKKPGQRTKLKAWGYTAIIDGKRQKNYRAEWTKNDAENALAALKLKIEQPKAKGGMTLAQAAERYVAAKARKRWLQGDRWLLGHLVTALGADTPLAEITASRISEYKANRLSATSEKTKRPLKAAGINRPLALLRHLLRLAHEEWEVLATVPKIRLEKEPQGRIRWLEPNEKARLLAACAESQNKHLAAMVILAIETGLRKGELLGLTWDRIDLSRGVIRLEVTKSGRRREVPMLQAAYDVLAGLAGPREGRVWTARNIRAGFENAVEAAGLEDFHFHDLRHHFASWYVMDGGSLQVLQGILGHSTLAMTMRYAHLSPEHTRADVAKVEAARERKAAVETAPNRAHDRAHEVVNAS